MTKDTEAEERGVICPQSDATLSPPGAQALEGGTIGGGGWVLPRMSPGLCVRHQRPQASSSPRSLYWSDDCLPVGSVEKAVTT